MGEGTVAEEDVCGRTRMTMCRPLRPLSYKSNHIVEAMKEF